jgi:RNA polymerase sigma-70 factor (ECF subfamily)
MDYAIEAAVADAHRCEWGSVLAATVRFTRDIDLAEECVQDAYTSALTAWTKSGVPDRPGAWLTTVARRRAIDLQRRRSTHIRVLPLLVEHAKSEEHPDESDATADDRLRLIFTCCHPALSGDARVALTLRLMCGLTTDEVARAFLVSESTMAARITRAKRKIATARIPYRVPTTEELPARVDAVLTVVHLLFATGHTAPTGSELIRYDLVDQSLSLSRMLHALLPEDLGVQSLLALILLTDARRHARLGAGGQLVLLADQDRNTWNTKMITEGIALVRDVLQRGSPDRFALMAAVAAVHAESRTWENTDWTEIVGLYDLLVDVWPSPVVALNRAVAIGFADGPAAGLAALDALADEAVLATYSYMAASRADVLRRLDRIDEARLAYQEALLLSENEVEREFLSRSLTEIDRPERQS